MRAIVRMMIVSLLGAATTSSLYAATYIVPTDQDLVRRAEGIVIATAVGSHSQLMSDGRIVTIATLALDEILKGEELSGQASIDLIEPGGVVGDRATFIPGSPRYEAGKHYLVFLRRTSDGWATYGFGLGQFEYVNDPLGRQVLTRGGLGEGIFGWDEISSAPHVEKLRDAIAFETFVKTIAASEGAPARTNYLVQIGDTELHSSSYSPKPAESVPGGLDGVSAIAAATANWTNAGAGVHYGVGVENPNATGGLSIADGINAVLFNDPANIIPAGVAAAGGISNESLGRTSEADVVVGKSFSTSQAIFNALMTHELGHTLGLRHSNEGTTPGSACGSPLRCTTNAIMNSTVSVQSLQQWDLDAIRTVYAGQTGTGTPSDYLWYSTWSNPTVNFAYCFAAIGSVITGQPASTSIIPGGHATLTVAASGTTTYQWYIGNPSNTTTTAPNGTSSSLTVSPASTTTYWVRVTACGVSQDSNAATVTVAPCVPPSAAAPVASPSSIPFGGSSTISETPSGTGPFTYQWYVGASGTTTSPIGGATNSSVTVSPTTTTSYWVRVGGACTPTSDSPATTVTVAACVPPSAPAPVASPSTIPTGQSSTLSVSPTGTSPFTYQWYIGSQGDTSNPIGGAINSSVSVSPTVTTNYWVKVTGQCAPPSNSPATTVTVTCAPINGSPSASPNPINPGQSSTLTVFTNGAGPFTFQWYNGNIFDTSNPIAGATAASTIVSPTTTSSYWVHVSAGCGSQDAAVLVNVNGPCIAPAITTQPAGSTVAPSTPVTLSVSASGTAPFTYQWYIGNKSDVSNPIAGATSFSTVQSPSVTTKYWVRVSHSCNAADIADSNTATITVTTCVSPSITTQPANVSVPIGTAATLKVVAAGSALHYQWFKGAKGDTSQPTGAADSATFVSGAISGNTTFWVRISNSCNGTQAVDSNAATVTATAPPRRRAVRH